MSLIRHVPIPFGPPAPSREVDFGSTQRWRPGWQIGLLIVGWPLWWALGLTQFIGPVLAIPLAWQLLRQHTAIRVPPGFWLWGLFLVWVAVSAVALNLVPDGTVPPHGFGRYLAATVRWSNYAALTVMMLYVGNTSESQLPWRRVASWFALLGVSTVVLGFLAVLFPRFSFSTLLSQALPSGLVNDEGGRAALAQVQDVLGQAKPRPAAPFPFTNAWGNSLSLLLIWVILQWGVLGGRRHRVLTSVLLAAAIIPIVYSLNRGMWLGLGIAIVVVAYRLAKLGNTRPLAALGGLLAAGVVVFTLSPLSTIVDERAHAPHSNEVRASLADSAVKGAFESPVLGFGSTRAQQGSDASITIGRTQSCPKCGNFDIGSTGQLWLVMFAQGLVGAALYVGFFVKSMWQYRTSNSYLGIAGFVVILLELYYALFYNALILPLAVTLLTIALLWREQAKPVRRFDEDQALEPAGPDLAIEPHERRRNHDFDISREPFAAEH
jgi:hypothetical protein